MSQTITRKTGHFAWCALVALHLARREGLVQSDMQKNLFLIRWLATAKKQRRFDRDVTPDIGWLLQQGRTLGAGPNCHKNWIICTAPVQAHYTSRAICSGSLMRLNRPRRQALPISY